MTQKKWQPSIAVALVLIVLTGAFFAPLLQQDAALAGSDFQQIHYPLLNFVVDSIHETGEIPLWNPHQFLGYSVVGNPQYGLFYPPNWLLLIFPGKAIFAGVGLLIALHFFGLALGTYFLARQWLASHTASLLAAIVVAFGGFPVSKLYAGHYAVLCTMTWLPWILAALHYALHHRRLRDTIPASLALGLSTVAGHPQFVYITGIGMAIYTLYFLWQTPPNTQRTLILRQSILILVLGLMLSAIMWMPVLDYQAQTVRGQAADSLTFANQHAIPLRQLMSIIVPDFFGNPLADTAYWGAPFYEEMTAYVGLLPLMFLVLIIAQRPRGWILFGTLVFIGLWLSLGKNAGLYAVQYYVVPPARGFRAPGRFLLLSTLGLGMLAALAITHLEQNATKHIILTLLRRTFLPAIIMLGGAAIAFALFGEQIQGDQQQAEYITQQLGISAVFLVVYAVVLRFWVHQQAVAKIALVALATANIWWAAAPTRNIDTVQPSPVWEEAITLLPNLDDANTGRIMQTGSPPGIINGASWIDAYSPQGYDPIAPAGWFALMDATGPFIEDAGSATNRLFGVRYVIAGQPLGNYGFATAPFFVPIDETGPYYFYENPQPLPRAYLTEAYNIEPNTETALQRIQAGEVDRGDLVLLDKSPDCDISGDGGSAEIVHYSPNQVEITVNATGAGLLVLGDQYDPDWQVFVDDEQVDLLKVNTTFRGVCVPDGQHLVRFSYRPLWFYRGMVISIIGLVIVIVVLIVDRAMIKGTLHPND